MPFIDLSVGSKGFVDADDVYSPEYTRPNNLDTEALVKDGETADQASVRINDQAAETFKTSVTTSVDNREDTVVVSDNITDGESKLYGIYSKDDLYIEDDVISRSPAYKSTEQKYFRNLQILSEEMEVAASEQEGKGIVGYGIDLVDREIIRATLFGWYENLSNRTAREGSRVFNNLATITDPKEMREFAKEYVAEIREEGVLKGDNAFAYAQMVREVYGKGYNPDAAWDKLFGVIDLAGFAGGVAKITKLKSLRSSTAASRAGALGGAEEANRVAESVHLRDVDPTNTADLQSTAVNLNNPGVKPSTGFAQRLQKTNEILKRVTPQIKEGAVPTAERAVKFDSLIKEASEKFSKTLKVNVYDVDVTDLGEQSKAVNFYIGKNTDGLPFEPLKDGSAPSGAKKIAARIGGEVMPLDPDDLSLGYVVKASESVDASKGLKGGFNIKLAQAKWSQVLGKVFDNKVVGSAAARDVVELNEIALRSQTASKYLAYEGSKQQDVIGRLNYEDTKTLDTIIAEFRDGPDSVGRQSWNETEFSSAWRTMTGETPSTKVIDAFKAAESLSDAAYYFKSMETMKVFIMKGFKNSVEVEDGIFLPAKRKVLSELAEDAKVFDYSNGLKLYAKEIDDIPKDTVVWELSQPWNGQDFVVLPNKVRPVDPRDVLGYSAYGRRTNPEARYFIFLRGESGVKTVLAAFSDTSAQTSVRQLKQIQEAYRTKGIDDEAITRVIQTSNDWNDNINTKAGMDKWLTDNGIDILDGDLFSKVRDDSIEDPFDKVFNGESAVDYVDNALARSDTILTEYGGGNSYNPSPLQSIVDQYGTEAHRYANSFYTLKSMKGWIEQLRIMREEGINLSVTVPDNIGPSDYRKLFLNTKVEGNGPAAERMRELQNTIKRRLGMTSSIEETLSQTADAITEQLYDSWGIKVQAGDVTKPLLKIGFFSAFSFNLSQAYLQSSQIINVVAIVGKNIGFKAAAGSVVLRKLVGLTDDIAVEELGLAGFAKNMGITDGDAKEIAELFRQTLPNVVMGDSIELGTGVNGGRSTGAMFGKAGFQATKVGQAIFDVGLKPFNFGESTAKSTSFLAAALEFKKANPNLSLLSEAGRNFVARRSETLTQNMSNSSRSALQSGVGKVPTQWLSYFFRTMEQVFVGRDLTGMERARLGFFTMPFFGMTGLGMGFTTEKIAEFFNLDPNDETDRALFITMKYGIIDGFLNHYTPFDVALSERMAPVPAIFDIYEKFTEENVLSAVGGPSGSIVYTGGEALFNLMSNVSKGYTSTLTEDSLRVLRNFSGINSAAKALGIVNDGIYRNRKGIRVPVEVDLTDALISFFGFTPRQVTEFYAQSGRSFNLSKDFKAIRKEVLEKSKLAWSIYGNDPQRASAILGDATTIVSKSPLTYDKKQELLRLLSPKVDDYSQILNTLYQNDKAPAARWASSLLRKD
tara:strand:- start:3650 stop:7954 length:4305 start_codon:yes stop_codon:yes gene_type:complete